ncbi:hypothetical protein B0A50_00720 [Salinomyces thailandicus]|uniref:Uncharacterized protein n=1 Tax=Salinomyces thailandicus TaxID=706561 RepID=A0A4U0UD44_9PEZI|nr:hypothetical protein B0A50_00720 [Salinomyces thailandica]
MAQYGPVPDLIVHGKIVLVTGGGSGIGFSFARLCHSRGARVVIGDLKLTPEAQQYLSQVQGDTLAFEYCDVSSWQSLHGLISVSMMHFGQVPDVYAPIAGVFEPPWSNFWDDNEQESYKTIQINVNHPVKLTRLAMRALAGAEKQGVVCLVASTAGVRGNYFATLYAASKHAVVGFVKSMGQADSEEGVKVVCVLPGMVQTPLWTERDDNVAEQSKYKERAGLQPAEIAKVMLRMVESDYYGGGTCVLRTPLEERIVEEGYAKSAGTYDPSPRPEPDMSRIKSVLQSERGKAWNANRFPKC